MKSLLFITLPLLMLMEHRQVYLFFKATGNALQAKQLAELYKDPAGLKDRDIRIQVINVDTADAKVKQWHVDARQPFTFLLVGKDGTEKLRSHILVTNEQLFAIIDAMPMRQREMKKKQEACTMQLH